MAIELVNGGSVTCVDNNYDIYYNGTTLRRIYACDTANNVCTLVYCKPQPTVTFNYLAVDTDLSSLNRSADISVYGVLGCSSAQCNCNNLYFCGAKGCALIRYNTTLSVTLEDTTPVCTGTCGIYDYCIWTANDFNSACVRMEVCECIRCDAYMCRYNPSCSYSVSPTNKTTTSATYSVNSSVLACKCKSVAGGSWQICCLCGSGTVTSNPSITRTVSYCATNTVTGETRCDFTGIENEESSINFTFDF